MSPEDDDLIVPDGPGDSDKDGDLTSTQAQSQFRLWLGSARTLVPPAIELPDLKRNWMEHPSVSSLQQYIDKGVRPPCRDIWDAYIAAGFPEDALKECFARYEAWESLPEPAVLLKWLGG